MFLRGSSRLTAVFRQRLSNDNLAYFEAVFSERQGDPPCEHESLLVRFQENGIYNWRQVLLFASVGKNKDG